MEQPKQYTPEEIAQLEKADTVLEPQEKEKFSAIRVLRVVFFVALWPVGIIYFFSLLPKFIIGPCTPTKRHPLLVSFVQVWPGLVMLLFMIGFIFTGHSADNLLPDGLLLEYILLLIIPISPALYILLRDSGREKTSVVSFLVLSVFIIGTALFSYYFFHKYFVVLTLAVLLVVAFGIDFFNKKK